MLQTQTENKHIFSQRELKLFDLNLYRLYHSVFISRWSLLHNHLLLRQWGICNILQRKIIPATELECRQTHLQQVKSTLKATATKIKEGALRKHNQVSAIRCLNQQVRNDEKSHFVAPSTVSLQELSRILLGGKIQTCWQLHIVWILTEPNITVTLV